MGKSKSLGFQIHSALLEINLQDKEKRTDIFNKENDTHYKYEHAIIGTREENPVISGVSELVPFSFWKSGKHYLIYKSKNK